MYCGEISSSEVCEELCVCVCVECDGVYVIITIHIYMASCNFLSRIQNVCQMENDASV